MIGIYDIEVYNNKIHYYLTVKRNLTLVRGDSASGKTELVRLVGEYEANGNSSGITLKCDKRCTVLTNVDKSGSSRRRTSSTRNTGLPRATGC